MSEDKDKQDINDFMTPMAQAAAASHEVYTSHIEAGFTPAQAMQIVVGVNREAFRFHMERQYGSGNQ